MIDAGLMAGGKPGVWELTEAGARSPTQRSPGLRPVR